MDSKSIYITARALLRKVKWEWPTAESEWAYLGDPNEVGVTAVEQRIAESFGDEPLYVVLGRHDSKPIEARFVAGHVLGALKTQDVIVCDHAFHRFVELSKIGIFRRGVVEP